MIFVFRMYTRWMNVMVLVTAVIIFFSTAEAANPRYEIVINIPALTLYLYSDGVLLKQYPIGVGHAVNPSKLGTTRIINNVKFPSYYPPDWYRKGLRPIPPGPENPVGVRWLGLSFAGYGIHGTNAPDSIGTAASAGCIRMHNDDVEQLASYVSVGTPVSFVYETVQAAFDPTTGTPYVIVYEDLYKQRTNTLKHAMQVLEKARIPTEFINVPALEALLHEAAGRRRPLPTAKPIFLNGEVLSFDGIDYGGRPLVPIKKLASVLNMTTTIRHGREDEQMLDIGGRTADGITWIGSEPYMSVDSAAQSLGMLEHSTEQGTIQLDDVVLLTDEGRRFPARPHVLHTRLLIPLDALIARFSLPVTWDAALGALKSENAVVFGIDVIDEKPYIAHDRLKERWGIVVDWKPGDGIATIRAGP